MGAEVRVGVAVVFAQRRGRHANLICGLEVLEDLAPATLVARATPVALVDDDQVEEVACVLLEEARAALATSERLVDGEVHLAALHRVAAFDLRTRVTERREHLGVRIIDEDVAVGEEQDARLAIVARAVPPRRPEFPSDLEGHERLARAGRHR